MPLKKSAHVPPKASANLQGCIALSCWTLAPFLGARLATLPPFQTLCTVFSLAFVLSFIRVSLKGNGWQLKQAKSKWLIGTSCIFLNQSCYLAAFHWIPAEHVELIYYLWPIAIALLNGLFPGERFCLWSLLGAFVGFGGLSYLILEEDRAQHLGNPIGYLAVTLAAITWISYNLFSRRQTRTPPETIGFYSGLATLPAFLCHLWLETPTAPSFQQWGYLLLMGTGTGGLAFFCWEKGIKYGSLRLLSVLAYLVPLFSVAFLVLTREATAKASLFEGAALISLGCFICWIGQGRSQTQALSQA